MAVGKRFRMRIISSTKVVKTERRPKPLKRVNVKPTTAEIIRAFKRSRGYEDVIARIPKAETAAGWGSGTQVAYFSVCQKSGSARFLDLWDCDHFDLVSDMQRSVADCRAWFSRWRLFDVGVRSNSNGPYQLLLQRPRGGSLFLRRAASEPIRLFQTPRSNV